MANKKINFIALLDEPNVWFPDSIYFIKKGAEVKLYLTSLDGTPMPLVDETSTGTWVESVLGTLVDNTDPFKPVINLPTPNDIGAQEELVSGTNIKTVNNESLLGSGNIDIQGVTTFAELTDKTTVDLPSINTPLGNALNNKADSADLANYIPISDKGTNNGVAELDATGKVPANQLPSFVDEISEYADLASFPATGESGKIYIALNTNKVYRWGGTLYTEISESIALGQTSTTAYRGDRGKIAYDHSLVTSGNPHNVNKSNVGLSNVDNTSDVNKPISNATQSALNGKEDITNKVTDFSVINDTLYPTVKAVNDQITGLSTLQLGETSTTAYRGDRGKTAYDHTSETNNPHSVTKTQVGLGNVDNTSDINKPVSTATQNALNLKANDNIVVKTSGTQTIGGSKTFTTVPKANQNATAPNDLIRLSQFEGVLTTYLGYMNEALDEKVFSIVDDEPIGSDMVVNMVSLTQAEYDAGTPNSDTFYIITDA